MGKARRFRNTYWRPTRKLELAFRRWDEEKGLCSRLTTNKPRRISAIALSKRLQMETGQAELVGFKIRGESTVGRDTRICFFTTGVLLRELVAFAIARRRKRGMN